MALRENRKIRSVSQAPDGWPSIRELNLAEQILLRAARRLSASNTGVPIVVPDLERFREEIIASVGHGFGVSLGASQGTTAASELEAILCTACCAGFHPLQMNGICEPSLTPDERFLLSFVAGCRANDPDHVRSLLSWLLHPTAMPIIAGHGQSVADIFQAGGLILPQRLHLAGCIGYSELVPCGDGPACTVH
ncbi:MAG: hypothetical protein CFH38_01067 [Alphaproteobacteria bacterium MarineAlpha10_Bin1]|nr:MAG: hypothetical protein CFH38_01067 [Alphaproteobacteria bacterium MarineAlpha10_Bin1]